MNITPADLDAEYKQALTQWPFLPDVEQRYNLPPFLLFAVGSRETNLRNVVGDGGHGNGVWQLDNRSHTIPSGFNASVSMQADTAAKMLRALLDRYHGNIRAALVAYNAGSGTADYNLAHGVALDTGTANNNYSADTYARMVWLQQNEETPMSAAELNQLRSDIADLKQFVHDIHSLPDAKNPKIRHQFSAYTLMQAAVHGIPGWVKAILHDDSK